MFFFFMHCSFCFIKFATAEDAAFAKENTHNKVALDKTHTIRVCFYDDLDKVASVSDEYVPPQLPPFVPRPDPSSWMADPLCRDQFVARYQHETEVYWANTITGEDPTLVYGGEREKESGKSWCESMVCWSPQGNYLTTFHPPGIRLWGGSDFTPLNRFKHEGVDTVDFSPCERYVVTYRLGEAVAGQMSSVRDVMNVWDVRSGEKLREFPYVSPLDEGYHATATISEEKNGKIVERKIRGKILSYDSNTDKFVVGEGNAEHRVPSQKVLPLQDPNRMKWSPDGQYLARVGCGIIQVYKMPSVKLLDSKSIAAKDVIDFTWSTKGNMISYWLPAGANTPALINIIQLPERKELCSRKIFDVQDGKMVWQDQGEYLSVTFVKVLNKKKTYVIMLFRVTEPEVPVELLEFNEAVLSVTWEPSGDRFVVITGEQRNATVGVYTMSGVGRIKGKKELTTVFSLSGRQCNEVSWSPAGGVIAIAHMTQDSCIFDLHDVDANITMATRKHDRCNRLLWDPSGRLIATCTISHIKQPSLRPQPDDGYNIYTFQGAPVCQVRKEKLFVFAWRPRNAEVLTPAEIKNITKNWKKYEKQFEKEDKQRKHELDSAANAERRKLAEEFLSLMATRSAALGRYKERRVALRDGYDSDDDSNYQVLVQLEETVVSTKEKVIG